jgi:hypothetical protein
MREAERVDADLTVVGGGIAGTCAAVAAAREGLDTVLVNDRPVLGGNSSSEVRVWVNGATGGAHNRYVREGGIMEEILLENKARNPDGNADLWDMVLQDLVDDEPNLDVYLNTLIDEVDSSGTTIESVAGSQGMSERRFRFDSEYFVDATGDGVLAAHTDAEWIQGREGTDAFDERVAPERPDEKTLGSSIMFYTEEREEPVPFEPPDFAHDFRDDPPAVLAQRADPDDRRCCYWWIEYGGEAEMDPIADNEAIRDELWAMAFGAFDYLKNSGEFPEEDVENLALDWVGKIPGKRESRRFRGAHVLTEHDLVEQRRFPDSVGHGGWSIDLHPPAGFYDDQGRGSEHWHLDGPYAVPYRSLYVPTVENMWLAGRHISASHVAFGSIRVQMTLGTLGQAVGTAAAIASSEDTTPEGVHADHLETLQQALRREDQWVIDDDRRDPADHAPEATVSASDERSPAVRNADTSAALEESLGVYLAADRHVDAVQFRLDAEETTDIDVTVHETDRPENYVPGDELTTATVTVPADGPSWVTVPVDVDPDEGQGLFCVLEAESDVTVLGRETRLPGIVAGWRSPGFEPDMVDEGRDVRWNPLPWVPCVEVDPIGELYGASTVTDGHARPYGLPHCWRTGGREVTRHDAEARFVEPPVITCEWDEPRSIAGVQLTFDTRLTINFNPLTPTDEPRVAETVRDYRIEARVGGEWETLEHVTGNYRRFRRHVFDPVQTDQLRVVVESTNGAPYAEVFELRAYDEQVEWPLTER